MGVFTHTGKTGADDGDPTGCDVIRLELLHTVGVELDKSDAGSVCDLSTFALDHTGLDLSVSKSNNTSSLYGMSHDEDGSE